MSAWVYVVLTLSIVNSILIILILIFLGVYLKEITRKVSELTDEVSKLVKDLKPGLNKTIKEAEATLRSIKNISNIISQITPFLLYSQGGKTLSTIGKYLPLILGIKKGFEIYQSFAKKGGKKNE